MFNFKVWWISNTWTYLYSLCHVYREHSLADVVCESSSNTLGWSEPVNSSRCSKEAVASSASRVFNRPPQLPVCSSVPRAAAAEETCRNLPAFDAVRAQLHQRTSHSQGWSTDGNQTLHHSEKSSMFCFLNITLQPQARFSYSSVTVTE